MSLAAALSLALTTPIQLLMIRTATEGELIGAAATQAGFNIGNALGAFFGGLPIAAGFGYNSPALVGAVMAVVGIFLARMMASMTTNRNSGNASPTRSPSPSAR